MTTDLSIIRRSFGKFMWGEVQEIVDLGPYTFVKFTCNTDGTEQYQVYMDGKNTLHSSTTLEGAMVIAVAINNLGLNSNSMLTMSNAACKLLGIESDY